MISESRQIIFVHNPKTGGSSIKRALKPYGFKYDDWHYNLETLYIKAVLPPQYYYKFSICRNPYDRFLSAFIYNIDKVANPADYHWKAYPLSYKILQRYLGDGSETSKIRSFRTFVKSEHFKQIFDKGWPIHFRKQCKFFRVCDLDDVCRFEALECDLQTVGRWLNIKLELPHINRTKHKPYQTFYDATSMDLVRNKYLQDFKEFGYNTTLLGDIK